MVDQVPLALSSARKQQLELVTLLWDEKASFSLLKKPS
jgi:hypothetical protein